MMQTIDSGAVNATTTGGCLFQCQRRGFVSATIEGIA